MNQQWARKAVPGGAVRRRHQRPEATAAGQHHSLPVATSPAHRLHRRPDQRVIGLGAIVRVPGARAPAHEPASARGVAGSSSARPGALKPQLSRVVRCSSDGCRRALAIPSLGVAAMATPGWLHGLVDYGQQLAGEGGQVDLVAQPGAEGGDGVGGVAELLAFQPAGAAEPHRQRHRRDRHGQQHHGAGQEVDHDQSRARAAAPRSPRRPLVRRRGLWPTSASGASATAATRSG